MSDYGLIINGEKVPTEDGFPVINPATEEVVGQCPFATRDQLDRAVRAASEAFIDWSRVADAERAAACGRIADALTAHAEELASLLTREQGKPLNGLGSRFELGGAAAWAGHTGTLALPDVVIQDDETARVVQTRKPVGVVGSITPWNWPLLIAVWHIVPAIRTGNTVVIKPSPYTPLSTLRMVEIMNEVLPPGVLNCVTGEDELGQWMTEHPYIQKIIFTGSINTGKKVMGSSAKSLKRLTLELGGNDAGIILDDVDPAAVAPGIIAGAFLNNGQTCAALKRLYVHDSIYDDMCAKLVEAASNVKMGNGLEEDTMQGPIQNKMQYDKVVGLFEDAVAHGGRVLCGGRIPDGPGYFMPYTLVADVSDGMRIVDEEQFGPLLPIIRYTDLDDAIRRANGLETGLGGSVWSADVERGAEIAARLECGTAWVNSHGGIAPNVPFGGVKCSGIGVEFGEEGLKEYTTIQVLNVSKAAA
ncbi:MAG: aldehyde dehydrogenase family protein [Gammaproteobacteria bacterium]|nr:aldehyde dehydrogenase family protein [Gammaproteobacteria bacterium]MDH5310371.1 aldehyde dehydrogenase family protein [Gammaproteobacteria bacterium]